MYSQNDEEKYIVEALKAESTKGRFLDIGAYDGKNLSNTYRLVELGWSGVCVEPSPTVFVGLMKNHQDNPNVSLVNAAISTSRQLVEFFDSNGDAVGTISNNHKELWKSAVKFRPLVVSTITWEDLLSYTGYEFDFLNLDVEGLNIELYDKLPLAKLKSLKVMCIEHESQIDHIMPKAKNNGFQEVTRNAENIIFKR